MKRIKLPVLILFCLIILGCSLPGVANYSQLHSFIKEEKIIKGGFGSKKKVLSVKDFRGTDMFDENIAALKETVEKYISGHPDLSEPTKNNLRELKAAEGLTEEEVEVLLGKPDRVIKRGEASAISEIWIYRINKMNAFTVFIFPIFFAHEGYYLYFKDHQLSEIQRHYLAQIIQQNAGPGIQNSR